MLLKGYSSGISEGDDTGTVLLCDVEEEGLSLGSHFWCRMPSPLGSVYAYLTYLPQVRSVPLHGEKLDIFFYYYYFYVVVLNLFCDQTKISKTVASIEMYPDVIKMSPSRTMKCSVIKS